MVCGTPCHLFFYFNRLYCSNLHFNENSNRKQATTAEGNLRWAIAYPKAFKGEKAVGKPLKEKPTYGRNLMSPPRKEFTATVSIFLVFYFVAVGH